MNNKKTYIESIYLWFNSMNIEILLAIFKSKIIPRYSNVLITEENGTLKSNALKVVVVLKFKLKR